MNELRVSGSALDDLRQIKEFLGKEVGDDFAANEIDEILNGAELLVRFPKLGAEGFYGPQRRNLRRLSIRRYFAYYAETETGILLLRVVHSKRDQRRALGQTDQPNDG